MRNELKTRTQIQHQLEEENEHLKQENNRLIDDVDYFKAKSGSLEDGYLKLQKLNDNRYEENQELKQELSEYKDYVFSDTGILCYTCVNCLKKGIYKVECSEKGKVDVHSSCLIYWKNEVR